MLLGKVREMAEIHFTFNFTFVEKFQKRKKYRKIAKKNCNDCGKLWLSISFLNPAALCVILPMPPMHTKNSRTGYKTDDSATGVSCCLDPVLSEDIANLQI